MKNGHLKRGLRQHSLDALREISASDAPHWWKDLLSLWEPSGFSSGEYGLRLAVRHNYLSFYYKGQAVAEVRFQSNHAPYAKVHHKYLNEGAKGQAHAKLDGGGRISMPDGTIESYLSKDQSVKQWINRIKKHHVEIEKCFVDDLVGANSLVIDLEMALPSYGTKKTADRIDCVALECCDQSEIIVFWEAKRIDDSRLVSDSGNPEVARQIKRYQEYLSDQGRAASVIKAYQTTCKTLVELREMAELFGSKPVLDPSIIKVANSEEIKLHIAHDSIRMLIIEGECSVGSVKRSSNWNSHADVLVEKEIWFAVAEKPSDYQFRILKQQEKLTHN